MSLRFRWFLPANGDPRPLTARPHFSGTRRPDPNPLPQHQPPRSAYVPPPPRVNWPCVPPGYIYWPCVPPGQYDGRTPS